VYSGVEFNVDPDRGLNGFCDFLISRSPLLFVVAAPLVAVAESKNDNIWYGFGQCVASMYAAWLFNERAGTPLPSVYGVSTTGTHWKLFRLSGTVLSVDLTEYFVDDLGRLLGVLTHMVANG
jgi:hypothetical protein